MIHFRSLCGRNCIPADFIYMVIAQRCSFCSISQSDLRCCRSAQIQLPVIQFRFAHRRQSICAAIFVVNPFDPDTDEFVFPVLCIKQQLSGIRILHFRNHFFRSVFIDSADLPGISGIQISLLRIRFQIFRLIPGDMELIQIQIAVFPGLTVVIHVNHRLRKLHCSLITLCLNTECRQFLIPHAVNLCLE